MPMSENLKDSKTANIQMVNQSGTVLLKFDIPNALIFDPNADKEGESKKQFLFES